MTYDHKYINQIVAAGRGVTQEQVNEELLEAIAHILVDINTNLKQAHSQPEKEQR